jgi:hypothetical protein
MFSASASLGQAHATTAKEPAFGPDKVKHLLIAGFVETVAFSGLQAVGANRNTARAGALAAVTGASIGREIHDRKKKGLFSIPDLVWDALGAGAALLVINKTQK